jgi:glycosyltransferase involved in cell wall biosynthesis
MIGKPATGPFAKSRIALFLPDLPVGGVERVMCNLATGLLDGGCDVDVVVGDASGPSRELVPSAATVVDLQVRRVAHALPGLIRYLRSVRPAGLVAAKDHANLIALIATLTSRVRLPVVVTVHAPHSEVWRSPDGRSGRAIPALSRVLYPRARAVVAVSTGIAEELRAQIPSIADRVAVVPNPVLDAEFEVHASRRPDHPWFEHHDQPVLVCAGRLEPQKDVGTLLDAVAQLRTRQAARLIVVGDGSCRDRLEAQAAELRISDDVDFVGSRSSAAPYLASADVVVLSSRFEGMPTVLVEALALGRRVVATDCPTGPRELLDQGAYGALVPVGDAAALARAIAEVLATAPPSIPAGVLEPYRPDAAARRYLELLSLRSTAS